MTTSAPGEGGGSPFPSLAAPLLDFRAHPAAVSCSWLKGCARASTELRTLSALYPVERGSGHSPGPPAGPRAPLTSRDRKWDSAAGVLAPQAASTQAGVSSVPKGLGGRSPWPKHCLSGERASSGQACGSSGHARWLLWARRFSKHKSLPQAHRKTRP